MPKQIYQFNNKASPQNNDLLLISDEETVNHQLKNCNFLQTSNYFFQGEINSYVPIFSNFTGLTVPSTLYGLYICYKKVVGNWVQVTLRIELICSAQIGSFDVTVPFGNNFTNSTDSIFVGCSGFENYVTSGVLGTIIQDITANTGTKTIRVVLKITTGAISTETRLFTFTFLYRLN